MGLFSEALPECTGQGITTRQGTMTVQYGIETWTPNLEDDFQKKRGAVHKLRPPPQTRPSFEPRLLALSQAETIFDGAR